MGLLILLHALLISQAAQSPWVVHFQNGDRMDRVVGYCDESDFSKDIFTIREDKPWEGAPTPRTLYKRDVKDYYRPVPAELSKYYAEGWKANGGIEIDTRHGKTWVFEQEYELAMRAADMALMNEATVETASVTPHNVGNQPIPESSSGFSFGQLWGAHIAVLTVGLGLSALVAWFLILE